MTAPTIIRIRQVGNKVAVVSSQFNTRTGKHENSFQVYYVDKYTGRTELASSEMWDHESDAIRAFDKAVNAMYEVA